MITRHTALWGLAVVTGTLFAATRADASSHQHIDVLALRIQSNCTLLNRELELHYRNSPHYPHLANDARNMYVYATRIHELAHRGCSPYYLSRDLGQLDQWFHHVERVIVQIEAGQQHGHPGHIVAGTSHVHLLMQQISCDIHQLNASIVAMTQPYYIGYIIRTPHRGHNQSVPHSGSGQGRGKQRDTRNYGEIRSGWTRSLSDMQHARA